MNAAVEQQLNAAVEQIMAMGLTNDPAYVRQLLMRTGGDPNMAISWLLDPEEMTRAEEEAARRRQGSSMGGGGGQSS